MSDCKQTTEDASFLQGVAAAVGHVARADAADQPTLARSILDGYGITVPMLEAAGVEDFDLDPIREAMRDAE